MAFINPMAIWHFCVLLLFCSEVKGDWKIDLHAWRDIPPFLATIDSPPKLTRKFESDWRLTFDLPRPTVTNGVVTSSQKNTSIRVEQNEIDLYYPSCGAILHEIGNIVPIAMENVVDRLYIYSLDDPSDEPSISNLPSFEKALNIINNVSHEKIRVYFIDALKEKFLKPAKVAKRREMFPPPNVDAINIIIKDYDFGHAETVVSTLETLDGSNPTRRTMYLSLGWLRQSWEDPLPWQTLEVRRHALTELITQEIAHIYQYTQPDPYHVKKSKNARPPPEALIEGISKFVTLSANVAWQGVKTPDMLRPLPSSWWSDSEHVAYFLLWLQYENRWEGAVARINHYIARHPYYVEDIGGEANGGESLWIDLFGVTSTQLWDEYTAYVDKEGYLSPINWIYYSLKSIKSSPQNTISWLTRIWWATWRKVCYWKRFTYTVFHLLTRKARILSPFMPVAFVILTLPAYKLAYDHIYLNGPRAGQYASALSAGASLLFSGIFRVWQGIALLASGFGVFCSGFFFLFWHGLTGFLKIEKYFHAAISWGFHAVPLWFGHYLMAFFYLLFGWIYLGLGIFWDVFGRLMDILMFLFQIPAFAALYAVTIVWKGLMIVLKILATPIRTPLSWVEAPFIGFFSWVLSAWATARSDFNSPPSSPSSSFMPSPHPSPPSSPPGSVAPSPVPPQNPSPVFRRSPSPSPSPPPPGPTYTPPPNSLWDITTTTSGHIPIHVEEVQQAKEKEVEQPRRQEPEQVRQEENEEIDDGVLILEEIRRSRLYGKKLKYRVKWVGQPAKAHWHDARELREFPHLIQEFHAQNPEQPGPPVRLSDWLMAARNGTTLVNHRDDNVARSH